MNFRLAILVLSALVLLGADRALAKGKHGCHEFGKANHCQARWDKRSKLCTC